MSSIKHSEYVDPFIGTGGRLWASAMLSPAACVPFGFVRPGPDTVGLPFKKCDVFAGTSGYCRSDRFLLGFSQTRLSGAGVREGGALRLIPFLDRPRRCLYFSHKTERAEPGYYEVTLPQAGCRVRITAAAHTSVYRFTFDPGRPAGLVLDAASILGRGRVSDVELSCGDGGREICGSVRLYGDYTSRCGGLPLYFCADFGITPLSCERSGARVVLSFGDVRGQAVDVRIALSCVSIQSARGDLRTETEGRGFDELRTRARSLWEERLSRIDFFSAEPKVMKIFYTALYHTMIMPTVFSDGEGRYRAPDGSISQADGFTYMTDMSLWDTFRTVHPLYSLIAPDVNTACVKSLLAMARSGGSLPRWPCAGMYTGSMYGTPADIMIADCMLRGTCNDCAAEALSFMESAADGSLPGGRGRRAAQEYVSLGYVPSDVPMSVSRTLEYAQADGAISRLESLAGRDEKAEKYRLRAGNCQNIFDRRTCYFRPKDREGRFQRSFSPRITKGYFTLLPRAFTRAYCEGGPTHWRWTAQPAQLVQLFGGSECFTRELERFMAKSRRRLCPLYPGSGYWHGNEHDIHCAYLFNEAGRPDLTQKWVRHIMECK